MEELGELRADGPSAEDDEALRYGVRPDGVAVRPELDLVQAVDGRHRRRRARRDDETPVLDLSLADGDDALSEHPPFAANELGALLGKPVGMPRVVEAVGYLVAPPEHALGVEARR